MKGILKIMLAAVFVFGATLTYAQNKKMRHENKEQKMDEYFEQLKTELNLTVEQEEQLKEIFEERNEKMKSQRPSKEEMADMDEAARKEAKMQHMKMREQSSAEMKERVSGILDEEQLAKFKTMAEEHKLEMKERHQHRKMHGEQQHRTMDGGDMHQHEDGKEHNH